MCVGEEGGGGGGVSQCLFFFRIFRERRPGPFAAVDKLFLRSCDLDLPVLHVVLTSCGLLMGLGAGRLCCAGRGEGDFGAVEFVWGISRFKSAAISHTNSAKWAPAAKLHRACKALHSTTCLGVPAKLTTQNPGAKFPAAKFATANLTWHEIPPPPPVMVFDVLMALYWMYRMAPYFVYRWPSISPDLMCRWPSVGYPRVIPFRGPMVFHGMYQWHWIRCSNGIGWGVPRARSSAAVVPHVRHQRRLIGRTNARCWCSVLGGRGGCDKAGEWGGGGAPNWATNVWVDAGGLAA